METKELNLEVGKTYVDELGDKHKIVAHLEEHKLFVAKDISNFSKEGEEIEEERNIEYILFHSDGKAHDSCNYYNLMKEYIPKTRPLKVGDVVKDKEGNTVEIVYVGLNTTRYIVVGVVNKEDVETYTINGKCSGNSHSLMDLIMPLEGERFCSTQR